jgi:crotonobetainyl-CoA:carnitine CoA-transferase CaiB-like acyl-CoA transferase
MRAGVPAGPVNTVPQAFAQDHATHRGMRVDNGAYRGVATPVRLGHTRATHPQPPPRFSQHTHAILAEAGFTADEIAELHRNDIVRERPLRR